MSDVTAARRWANAILAGANDEQASRVVDAVNGLPGGVGRASVILACAQILAQSITNAPPGLAAEVRDGILIMIDDYAMHFALDDAG
jgi:hypothetical protein